MSCIFNKSLIFQWNNDTMSCGMRMSWYVFWAIFLQWCMICRMHCIVMFAQVSASGYLDIKFTILVLICNQLVCAICVIMHVMYMSYKGQKVFTHVSINQNLFWHYVESLLFWHVKYCALHRTLHMTLKNWEMGITINFGDWTYHKC